VGRRGGGADGEQVILRVAGSEDILDEDTAERTLDTLSFKWLQMTTGTR